MHSPFPDAPGAHPDYDKNDVNNPVPASKGVRRRNFTASSPPRVLPFSRPGTQWVMYDPPCPFTLGPVKEQSVAGPCTDHSGRQETGSPE